MTFSLETRSSAVISPCGLYRYTLSRLWDDELPPIAFVGLNPSTADATKDDPTIRRCIAFARRWNCGGLYMLNLFAFRATDPDDMKTASDPVGPENDRYILEIAKECPLVIAAWGTHGGMNRRDVHVMNLLENSLVSCLSKTKDGFPRHPLYVRGDVMTFPYNIA